MSVDPYQAPSGRLADPPETVVRWVAALIGGAAGGGAAYVAGNLLSPFFQHWYTSQGVAIDDLYATMMQSPLVNVLGQLLNVFGGILGGLVAAHIAGVRPFAHSAVSALVPCAVVVVSYMGVYPAVIPLWSQALSFVLPIPSALIGGWLYAARSVRL